jgi:hypothetical protein
MQARWHGAAEVKRWLQLHELEQYADSLINDGWDSLQLLKQALANDDVSGALFEGIKPGHRYKLIQAAKKESRVSIL